MAICPNCGQPIPDKSRYCAYCGTDIGEALQRQAPYIQDKPSDQTQTVPGGSRKIAVAGFVLSMISLVCFLGGLFFLLFRLSYFEAAITNPYFDITRSKSIIMGFILLVIALVFAVPGLVLSVKGRKNPARRGLGTAGLWTGIIVIALIVVCDLLFGFYVWFGFLKVQETSVTCTGYGPAVEEVEDAAEELTETVQEMVTEAAPEAW